ncbi:MAG: PAS-domain containing protein, partial [Alphaproteobacteria bacterium]|nr:PAS-domain containing protein [Alphaproteobacteria bacterium]
LDVTREVEIESRRQQAEQSFLRAIDVLPVAFTMYDSRDRLVTCNRVYRQSYGNAVLPAEAGVRFEDMVDAFVGSGRVGHDEAVRENWRSARLKRRASPARGFLYCDTDGRWVEVNDYLLDDNNIITLAANVTERQQAEEKIRRHELELAQVLRRSTMGEMAAMLAHELNQPLTATLNFSTGAINRLKSDRLDQNELLTVLHEIHAQAERAEGGPEKGCRFPPAEHIGAAQRCPGPGGGRGRFRDGPGASRTHCAPHRS